MEISNAIIVKNLTKTFVKSNGEKFKALDNISFSVKKGELLGIIGPNGSGKSTLLKVLSGVTRPDSGSVQINGQVSSILDIGSGFHPDLSGVENIKLRAGLTGRKTSLSTSLINEIIEFGGLEEFAHEPVKNYSSGMFIRLAFSIFQYLHNEVLLIDEVLSAGDLEFRNQIENKNILSGATGIVVSHELNEVSRLCKRVIVLDKGKIVRDSSSLSSISNYEQSSLGLDSKLMLNDTHSLLNLKIDDEFAVQKISMLNQNVSESDRIGFEFLLRNESRDLKKLIFVPVLRRLGQLIDLHSDSITFQNGGEPIVCKGNSELKIRFTYPKHFFGKGIYSLGLIVAKSESVTNRWEHIGFFRVSGQTWEKGKSWNDMLVQNRTHLDWDIISE